MKQFEALKQQFLQPPAEFSPIPFWFWNDDLSREEIIRQIHDFHSKEVDGFVIHPRMGLPRTMPYLSESYMELVEAAVAEAASLGMMVILYDEGMYPSGSACGMVVKQNPEYASRGLELKEFHCEGSIRIPVSLSAGEELVSAVAVRKLSERRIDAESTRVLEHDQDSVQFTPPDSGKWSILLFIDTYSKGTIRGVHPGQDDGEPDAPLAADLLNPDAVQAFISLTHDKYAQKLGGYFGNTVTAMFTDEPDLLGRAHTAGLKPWTRGLLRELLAHGGKEEDLAVLWFDAGEETEHVREVYESVVRNRLANTYYKPLADWCEAHGIGLTGHPAGSDDIGLLEHFHIPGQDVVWRYVAPEEGKALTGIHSTMGKCSSDSARHRGRRRNLNECFGVCGTEGGWSLSADNMKWYLDWLFVRGVNLICPHAFYYSIRDERRDERPPDVGPNNIWWPEYGQFSRYIKRMSWLMTDGMNGAAVAVLTGPSKLPWKIVKPLYEQQIEFNYLEEALLNGSCECKNGVLEISGYRYRAILIEDSRRLAASSWDVLEMFARQGGLVLEQLKDGELTREIGQVRVVQAKEIPGELARRLGRDMLLEHTWDSIRISRVSKNGIVFYVVVNEGDSSYKGTLKMSHSGYTEVWRPWSGDCEIAELEQTVDGQRISFTVERRECLVIAVDPGRAHENNRSLGFEKVMEEELTTGWRVPEYPWIDEQTALTSWTNWTGLGHYSGTITYEKVFEIEDPSQWEGIKLDLGVAHELVRLWVNGQEAGVRMWSPYVFDIRPMLCNGLNVLRVAVTNSLANGYDGKSLPSGLLGPVRLFKKRLFSSTN